MKKLLIAAAAMLLCTSSFAQFGIIGGLTSSSSSIKNTFQDLKTLNLNQYNVGITYKFGIGKVLAIQPALVYDVKGAYIKDVVNKESGLISDMDAKTGFLELPVMIQVGYDFGKIVRAYGIAAPFIGYALANNITWNNIVNKNWDMVKRFEYGAELGAGVELFKHLEINLTYFWNFGDLYGLDVTWESLKTTIGQTQCGGIKLTAAVLF